MSRPGDSLPAIGRERLPESLAGHGEEGARRKGERVTKRPSRRLSKNSPSKFISPCHQTICEFSSLIKVVSLLARTYGKKRRILGQPPRRSQAWTWPAIRHLQPSVSWSCWCSPWRPLCWRYCGRGHQMTRGTAVANILSYLDF
jgi:hypothetical protein